MSQQNNSIDKSRRNSIRGALGGVAVVSVWHKPVVNSLVLPAHAQMSPEVVMNFRAGSTSVTTGPLGRTDTLLDKLKVPLFLVITVSRVVMKLLCKLRQFLLRKTLMM